MILCLSASSGFAANNAFYSSSYFLMYSSLSLFILSRNAFLLISISSADIPAIYDSLSSFSKSACGVLLAALSFLIFFFISKIAISLMGLFGISTIVKNFFVFQLMYLSGIGLFLPMHSNSSSSPFDACVWDDLCSSTFSSSLSLSEHSSRYAL